MNTLGERGSTGASPASSGGDRPHRCDRAQSELFGVLLLLAIVALAVAVLLVASGATLRDGQQSADVAQAEKGLTQLDSRASLVALGDTRSQRVELGLDGRDGVVRTRPDDGWLRVRIVNATTGVADAEVVNATLGSVVYADDRTTVAYQGGGVWRKDGDYARMVSRPEFHFRNGTLTLPVVSVGGDRALDSRVRLVRAGPRERKFPNRSAGLTNKVRGVKVTVTVGSEYYTAWGRYFERTTDGIVFYDHAAETVTVKFLSLPKTFRVRSGIIATAGTGRLELHGTGAYTDSYDSSEGTYAETAGKNGTVEAVGDVYMAGNSTVYGNLRSGSTVEFTGGPSVFGDIRWTDPPEPDPGKVDGEESIARIDGVATIEPIDGYVFRAVDRIRAENNNSETAVVSGGRVSLGKGESGTLDAGRYYAETVDLQGGTLVLNTTGGDVFLAVEDWIRLERNGGEGANLTVLGDGTARLFVAGEEETAVSITGLGERHVNLHVGKRSTIHVPNQDSTQLRVFGPKDFNGTVAGDNSPPEVSIDGVIYAPAGRRGEGYVYVKQADFYGGIVTGTLTIGQYGAVHYDEAIRTIPFPRSPTVSRLEYMHVAVHHVNATG